MKKTAFNKHWLVSRRLFSTIKLTNPQKKAARKNTFPKRYLVIGHQKGKKRQKKRQNPPLDSCLFGVIFLKFWSVLSCLQIPLLQNCKSFAFFGETPTCAYSATDSWVIPSETFYKCGCLNGCSGHTAVQRQSVMSDCGQNSSGVRVLRQKAENVQLTGSYWKIRRYLRDAPPIIESHIQKYVCSAESYIFGVVERNICATYCCFASCCSAAALLQASVGMAGKSYAVLYTVVNTTYGDKR